MTATQTHEAHTAAAWAKAGSHRQHRRALGAQRNENQRTGCKAREDPSDIVNLKDLSPLEGRKRREREMLSIVLPLTFKIGDTQAARVNKEPATLFWRDKDTMVLNGTDTRKILLRFDDGALRHFACTDADGTPRAVDVIVEGWTIKVRERAN
jgi:hypothetical protein